MKQKVAAYNTWSMNQFLCPVLYNKAVDIFSTVKKRGTTFQGDTSKKLRHAG